MKKIRFAAALTAVFILIGAFTVSCRKSASEEDTTAATEADTTTEAQTTEAEPEPQFTNPLTGLACDSDLSSKRPVSIMVNNIYASLPQEGIGQADIMYECLAEGGITRLMMISTEYDKLTKVGSVRSARDYYIDYAESYDCIFVHAGGSTYAYDTFSSRGSDHIDGVNGPADLFYTTNTFIRDPERLQKYSSEHTLMVQNGEGLVNAVDYYSFRTEKNKGYETPMNFALWGETTALSDKALHVRVVMSNYQTVDYVYSEKSGEYSRYQYSGEPHIDNTTGEQLSFENVILVLADTGNIAGDEKARIWVETTGEGSGWYLTDGAYSKITWKKASHESPISYYFEDGTPVALNRGKTMINVVPSYNSDSITFDNEWSDK